MLVGDRALRLLASFHGDPPRGRPREDGARAARTFATALPRARRPRATVRRRSTLGANMVLAWAALSTEKRVRRSSYAARLRSARPDVIVDDLAVRTGARELDRASRPYDAAFEVSDRPGSRGWQAGGRAEPLFALDWSSVWSVPIVERRAQLGLDGTEDRRRGRSLAASTLAFGDELVRAERALALADRARARQVVVLQVADALEAGLDEQLLGLLRGQEAAVRDVLDGRAAVDAEDSACGARAAASASRACRAAAARDPARCARSRATCRWSRAASWAADRRSRARARRDSSCSA